MDKTVLQAQLDLYRKGQQQAIMALEKAKSDVAAFNGAIEACENLIRIEEGLEKPTENQAEIVPAVPAVVPAKPKKKEKEV